MTFNKIIQTAVGADLSRSPPIDRPTGDGPISRWKRTCKSRCNSWHLQVLCAHPTTLIVLSVASPSHVPHKRAEEEETS